MAAKQAGNIGRRSVKDRISVVALIKVASNATIVHMSRALEEVAREAIELSQEERLVLARILLEGCDLPGYPINEAEQTWEEEIR